MKKIKKIVVTAILLATTSFYAQVGIGTTTPHASALLDVTSTTLGFLPPRMTQAQRDAIASPAAGLIIWCTDCGSSGEFQGYNGSFWTNLVGGVASVVPGTITSITCGSATNNGTLISGVAASSVSSVISYTAGNGGPHNGQTVFSTGVTGLSATLAAGTFANGSGNLTYNITGTPASAGTASFAINIGGQTCTITRTVNAGLISSINCAGATATGTLVSGVAASGVSSVISYTDGNGGPHSGQTVTSTGVTGLTATLTAGTFASGLGTLTFNITGTPASAGTASFAINIGSQTCTLTRTVNAGTIASITCGSATNNGTLYQGVLASGVTSVIPYSGGNGGTYTGQTVTSTGISGLTATLAAGTFASGSGTLTYIITGTPANVGTASFAINIGGQTCTLTRLVNHSYCIGKTISATPCSTVAGATINDDGATTIGVEYNWTGATISGMANTSTTRAIVDIGGQCWMRYNMDNIPSTGTYSYYSGGPFPNEGRLYAWNAAMNGGSTERGQGICPSDWHIPSDCEWMYLENTLGMSSAEQTANSDRTTGTVGSDLSTFTSSGTNSSGFSALLAGSQYNIRGAGTAFWTSTQGTVGFSAMRNLSSTSTGISRNATFAGGTHHSIRCLKN